MTVPEPIHPGEHLAEIMQEMGITQYRLAKTIGVPQIQIHNIVRCRRSITADTALRIGQALGMTPEFWLNLQRMYNLDRARAATDETGQRQGLFISSPYHARSGPIDSTRSQGLGKAQHVVSTACKAGHV